MIKFLKKWFGVNRVKCLKLTVYLLPERDVKVTTRTRKRAPNQTVVYERTVNRQDDAELEQRIIKHYLDQAFTTRSPVSCWTGIRCLKFERLVSPGADASYDPFCHRRVIDNG